MIRYDKKQKEAPPQKEKLAKAEEPLPEKRHRNKRKLKKKKDKVVAVMIKKQCTMKDMAVIVKNEHERK